MEHAEQQARHRAPLGARYYDFWIADRHHYTVEIDGNDEPTAVWFDDLDHPQPALEWRSGEPQSKEVQNAIGWFREREHLAVRGRRSGAVPALCKPPVP
jgi:hypothetical protein